PKAEAKKWDECSRVHTKLSSLRRNFHSQHRRMNLRWRRKRTRWKREDILDVGIELRCHRQHSVVARARLRTHAVRHLALHHNHNRLEQMVKREQPQQYV